MHADPLRLRADLLLLLAAVIWGFAFVAQRTGMAHLGPFAFNAVRFFIGGLVLLPVIAWTDYKRQTSDHSPRSPTPLPSSIVRRPSSLFPGLAAGAIMFGAAALQQVGIVSTTAGKAGFITSLYVVLVPLLGLLVGHRAGRNTWLGAILAAVGLYFLTMQGDFRMAWGDLLVLIGSVLWATHMLLLGHFSPGRDPLRLACVQFMACAALSGVVALLVETTATADLRAALIPILWTGVLSVGVGYTLQVVGQRHAPPADAAIILSLEAVFAVVGGWLLLGEHLSLRALFGCALMMAGILASQVTTADRRRPAAEATPVARPQTTDD